MFRQNVKYILYFRNVTKIYFKSPIYMLDLVIKFALLNYEIFHTENKILLVQ